MSNSAAALRFTALSTSTGAPSATTATVGCFVEIQKKAVVGKNCKISSHTFICEGVTIEDNVFVGHNVSFVNDIYPRATAPEGTLQTDADWQVVPTLVRKGASIGSGATILGGVEIGENAIVGARRRRHEKCARKHHRRGKPRKSHQKILNSYMLP